jgi:glycosyltransferase involved in cell wall biosynthesis
MLVWSHAPGAADPGICGAESVAGVDRWRDVAGASIRCVDAGRRRRLSIWIVDPIGYSGLAYYDVGLGRGLAEAGARVTIVSPEPFLLRDHALVGMADSGHIVRESLGRTSTGGSRLVRGSHYAWALAQLTARLMRARPDVVVWEYLEVPPLEALAMLALRVARIRSWYVAHETEPWERSRVRRGSLGFILRHASDRVVVNAAEDVADLRRSFGVPPGRVVVGGHGDFRWFVDPALDQASARGRLHLPPEAPVALFFGSLRPAKGLGLLLDAWPMVRSAVPDALLLVVGRPYRGQGPPLGPEVDGLTIRAERVSAAEADDCYAACDVVVLPYERITTSGVLRHAASAGRPVVATEVGELGRHVRPGRNGWLVAPGDRQALAAALAEALTDRSETLRRGRQAREDALEAFSWSEIGVRLASEMASAERVRDG